MRLSIIFLALSTALTLFVIEQTTKTTMSDANFISGWLFFTFLILLMLYYIRKKLSVLPLGNMEHWLSFHLLCATGFVVTYFFHIGFTLPEGLFNLVLWASNLAVIATGLLGWIFSRTLPREIHQIADKPIQEEIPQLKQQLASEAEKSVLDYLQDHYSEPLHKLFVGSIYPFLLSSPSLLSAITQGHKPFRQLLSEIEALDYFVPAEEKSVLAQLKQKVKRKHHFDKQSMLQSILRHWLFLHASSVLILTLCVVLHIFAVYGFSMGGA